MSPPGETAMSTACWAAKGVNALLSVVVAAPLTTHSMAVTG